MLRKTLPVMCAGVIVLAATAAVSADHHGEKEKADTPDLLTIGDPAPAVDIPHWLIGDAVESFEEGKIYVLEFWATWCGPCIASIPHLSTLQEKYRDYGVTIIGVSDEPLQTIVSFLHREHDEDQTYYDVIDYTLATNPTRETHTAYMTAAAQRGIPTSFVIGKTGKIEWIGHPQAMDDPLDAIVRDDWDRDAFQEEFIEQQKKAQRQMRMQRKMRDAREDGDWERMLALYDQALEEDPDAVQYKVQRYLLLLGEMDRPDEAHKYGEEIAKEMWDEPFPLNYLAWMILDDSSLEHRDLDFAYRLAERACELTEYEHASIIDTLARAYYEKGDLDKAIEWQRKAVDMSDSGRMKDHLQQQLDQYKAERDGDN